MALGICMLAATVMAADLEKEGKYVASKKGKKYHKPECSAAKRIKQDNLVTFDSAEKALKAGYTPCKICVPPIED
jgi:micrococcal nuclease